MSYPYQPIDLPNETRILTVHPGEYGDALVCSLSHLPLAAGKREEAEKYECLSYCWSKSVNVEFVPPGDTMVAYVYGSGEDESGQIPFRDMLDHPELHRTYIQFGGVLPPGTILCDGIEVPIGGELHRALQHIRSRDTDLRLWVDALCIDQGNVEERNKHVRMIGSIYAGASALRIWLGEDTGIEERGLKVLVGIYEIVEESLNGASLGSMSPFEIQKALQTHPKSVNLDWESLMRLFMRAWFRRTWVLQEVAMSSEANVHLGQHQVSWDSINSALNFAMSYKMESMLNSITMKPMLVMNWLREKKQSEGANKTISVPLLNVLEEIRVFESTLPSDKIYGVLGLASATDNVVVDYALDAEDVFTRLVVNTLQNENSLDILSHCMLPTTPSKLSLPSWVPDWTVHGWVEPFRSRKLRARAARDTEVRFEINSDDRSLRLWGKALVKVEAIESTKVITTSHEAPESLGAPMFGIRKVRKDQDIDFSNQSWASEDRSRDRFHHLRGEARNTLYDIHKVASPEGKPSQEIRDRMARTFAFNRKRDGSEIGDDFSLGFDVHSMITCANETVEGVYRWMTEEATGCDVASREGRAYRKRLTKAYDSFSGSYFRWGYNRRFLRTEGGYFGWGVNGVEVGDVVVVFYGGDYPFILREVNGQYKIIGDCYLENFMDGEALSDAHAEQLFEII